MAATDEGIDTTEPVVAGHDKVVPAAEASVDAKKGKEKKANKRRAPSAHPPYVEMVSEAITTLKERTGSSLYAIGKFIADKHKAQLPSHFKKLLLHQLKKLTASGKLTKVKNSYKLSPSHPGTVAKSKLSVGEPKSKTTTKRKPKSTGSKPRSSTAKSKTAATPKAAATTRTKAVAAAKPKVAASGKPKVAAKPKAVAVPKPKAAGVKRKAIAAAKLKEKPAKVAKTSGKASPGKKVVAPKKGVAVAGAVKRPNGVKSVAGSPAKRAGAARKTKRQGGTP